MFIFNKFDESSDACKLSLMIPIITENSSGKIRVMRVMDLD